MSRSVHRYFMGLALEEAERGRGMTAPNPMVGAVLVKGGRLIGRGYHHAAGLPHAEINALRDSQGDVRGATIYVTLEPCCHHGRTPPCTEALIKSGVSTVVLGAIDSSPMVSGAGVSRLEDAGIDVITGVMEKECRRLNEGYFKMRESGRPFVTLKIAATLDGRIATASGHSKWLSAEPARAWVHEMRARSDAVMVGRGTARADDPQLNVRLAEGPNPKRVVLDSRLSLPRGLKLFCDGGAERTYVLTTVSPPREGSRLQEAGVVVLKTGEDSRGRVDLGAGLRVLAEQGINDLFVEGGGGLATSLLRSELVDRFHLVLTPRLLGADAVPWCGPLGAQKVGDGPHFAGIEAQAMGPDLLLTTEPQKREAD